MSFSAPAQDAECIEERSESNCMIIKHLQACQDLKHIQAFQWPITASPSEAASRARDCRTTKGLFAVVVVVMVVETRKHY
ncbi:hypothetical protein E2C01_002134 [Portunus trituberculatus]|uniref:Uncharacterized protein n=1 Tax=Portunus trituberculatus TaxID=210409 RepID=A0A5B7CJ27_PORTR|nr:hypothetical protein [Portunus trituberculatus]